jgi:hypothetical protein
MGRIKGAAIRARLDYVRARHGDGTLARILPHLPDVDRAVLEGALLPSAWYPFRILERFDRALVAEIPGDEEAIFDDAGRHVAHQHARSIYRVFFRDDDPDRVLRVASCVFSSYYSGLGRAAVVGVEDGSRRIQVEAADVTSRGHCRATLAYFREVLVACTARVVRARELSCRCWGDGECAFDFSWDPVLDKAASA